MTIENKDVDNTPDDKERIKVDNLIFDELITKYPDEKKKRLRKKDIAEEEAKSAQLKKETESAQLINMLLIATKDFIKQKDYPEINPMQEMFLVTGLNGLIKKYDLYSYMSIEEQPEIAIGVSVLWYGYDFYIARNKKHIAPLDKKVINNE